MRIAIDILIAVSLFFAFAGTVGLLRMPDAFSRMQASTCISTLGIVGVLIGAFLDAAFVLNNVSMAVKIIVLAIIYILSVPISGHALAKGAYRHGVRPNDKMICDQYGEDLEYDE